MPTYISSTDLQVALGGESELRRLTKKNPADTNFTNECINAAESMIDSFCSGSQGFPFSAPYPELIIQLSIDLSIYKIYERRWSQSEIPAQAERSYNNALDTLKKILMGEISVIATNDPPQNNLGKGFYFTPNSTPDLTNPRRTLRSTLQYL